MRPRAVDHGARAQPLLARGTPSGPDWIEPQAGAWHTWVLTAGSQLRPRPPPDAAASQAELEQVRALTQQRDAAARDQIAFWDTGAPSYRWNELVVGEALKRNLTSNFGARALALLHVAVSDAMVATWEAKYAYQRPRPSGLDASLAGPAPQVQPGPAPYSQPEPRLPRPTPARAVDWGFFTHI